MSRPPLIPESLRHGPFTRQHALASGLTSRPLQGRHFVRLHQCVWVWAGHDMTHDDWILAAQLAVPSRARVSHVTRIQQLGLDVGPATPIHLTLTGDHHLDLDDVFVHRTEVQPPATRSV